MAETSEYLVSSRALVVTGKLEGQYNWAEWLRQYQSNAQALGVWHVANPDPGKLPRPKRTHKGYLTYTAFKTNWDAATTRNDGLDGIYQDAMSEADCKMLGILDPLPFEIEGAEKVTYGDPDIRSKAAYNLLLKSIVDEDYHSIGGTTLYNWATRSVSPALWKSAITRLKATEEANVRTVVMKLRANIAPLPSMEEDMIRDKIRLVHTRGRQGGINPVKWYDDWSSAVDDGLAIDLPELKGNLPIRDFLSTVKVLDAEWAMIRQDEVNVAQTLGKPCPHSLEEYGLLFRSHAYNRQSEAERQGIFHTGGGETPQGGKDRKGGNDAKDTCPCGWRHSWAPESCQTLRYALRGVTNKGRKPSQARCTRIREIIADKRHTSLRKALKEKQWLLDSDKLKSSDTSSGHQEKDSQAGSFPSYPGPLVAAVFDCSVMEVPRDSQGIFTTGGAGHTVYSSSTLLDNCGATHLVNDMALLVPGSFVRSTTDDVVVSGKESYPVQGRGRRIMKGIFNGANGPSTVDLTLTNVAVVEGFHVNIVSEKLLRVKNMWYCGYDCTVRYGTPEKSVILKELTSRYNLTFLEFRRSTGVFSVTEMIPESTAGIFAVPSLAMQNQPQQSRQHRPSRDPPKPRENSAELWHARAGHLGAAALEALVYSAQNVKIKGISRINCEVCAKVYARKVISRRPGHNPANRPFFRVHWDIFHYELGYDGSEYFVLLMDEYSGKVWLKALRQKTKGEVFSALRNFEAHVSRSYGTAICIFRSDNESAVTTPEQYAATRKTEFETWAEKEGIILEHPPTETHEPNGRSERAGQEIINKSNAMLQDARLPSNLWPETTKAAAYLYNFSPRAANGMMSPNETLLKWYRKNLSVHNPTLLEGSPTDLRPDWSGIYAYGCRAYVLDKEREAGRRRKFFKTHPRAHVGYLVGYRAANIYRIWVPQLERVITTRNVAFDEEIFYDPDQQKPDQKLQISEEDIDYLVITMVETRDAGSNLGSLVSRDPEFDNLPSEQDSALAEGQTEQQQSHARLEAPVPDDEALSQSSGVEASADGATASGAGKTSPPRTHGLMTPEKSKSPEPGQLGEGYSAAHDAALGGSPEILRNRGVHIPDAVEGPPEDLARDLDSHSLSGESVGYESVAEDEQPPNNATDTPATETQRQPAELGPTSSRSRTQSETPGPTRVSTRTRRAPKRLIEELSQEATSSRQEGRTRRQHVAATLSLYDTKTRGSAEHLNWFLDTFFPENGEDEGDLQTFHAVYAAAVSQKSATRLKAAPAKPRYHYSDLVKAPRKVTDLKGHPMEAQFWEAMKAEINKLIKKGTWREMDRGKAHTRPLPLKWVFLYKFDADGFLTSCKARICVRGDLQPYDTWQNTYASTLTARSFRVAMAMMARFDLECKQLDITNAFLNASLDQLEESILCELPDGFKKDGKIVELDKALYGLRESPLLWFNEFSKTLKELGLVPCSEDPCLFQDPEKRVLVLFYVDDILVLYHKDHEGDGKRIIEGITGKYEARMEGDVEWYLGIRVKRDRQAKKVWLVHDLYIEKVCKRYDLVNEHTRFPKIPLPCTGLERYEGKAPRAQVKAYQERVGSLVYCTIMTRPDVAFSATELSKHLQNPGPAHLNAVNQAILYLFAARYLAIQYGGEYTNGQLLTIASDASFADDEITRRSSQGYVFSLYGGPILWKAARQATVTTSTTEAELLALEHTAKEAIALERFFRSLSLDLGQLMEIFCDNQQTIRLVVGKNERISTRLRHVDIQNLWLRQEYARGKFLITYLPTADMPADGLTKCLPRQKFENFRRLLNLQDTQAIVAPSTVEERNQVVGRRGKKVSFVIPT
jgi:hypothetical protein